MLIRALRCLLPEEAGNGGKIAAEKGRSKSGAVVMEGPCSARSDQQKQFTIEGLFVRDWLGSLQLAVDLGCSLGNL